MNGTKTYFNELKKPSWAPPAWLFGPVWTILYVIMAVSFGKVFLSAWSGEIPVLVALSFVLNLIFNFSFTFFQFKLKNNYLAAIDIILVLLTLKFAMAGIYPYIPWVAYINTPYLLWVIFATVLQLTITYMNR